MVFRKIAIAINDIKATPFILLFLKRGEPRSPLINTLTNKVDKAYLDFMSVNGE